MLMLNANTTEDSIMRIIEFKPWLILIQIQFVAQVDVTNTFTQKETTLHLTQETIQSQTSVWIDPLLVILTTSELLKE